MSRILDLSVFSQETLDITMPDGAVMRVPKPSQRMVIAMLNLRGLNENAPSERIAKGIDNLVLDILAGNVDGRPVTREDVDALTLEMKTAVIEAYSGFAFDLQANPTSASPKSPESGAKPGKAKRNWPGRFGRWRNTRD